MLRFESCEFEELAAAWDELVSEYIEETANPVIGKASAQMDKYRDLDAKGQLSCLRVTDDDVLAGAVILLVAQSQHYPFPMVGTDFFYLRKPWRKGTVGLKLISMIKAKVKEIGAPGLPIMAPPESPLDRLCQLRKYTRTHNCYWCPCDE